MPSISRSLVIAALPFATLFAQEAAPTAPPLPPTSEAGPSANPVPETPVSTEPAASPAPEAEPTPAAEASPTPAPGTETNPDTPPPPPPDVIPMEGQPPADGAPLDTAPLAPEPLDQAMPDAAFTDPNAIIPDTPPSMPKTLDNEQEKARALTIRYKEVRVKVEKDPKVASLFAQSESAKSEEEKRSALREYYRLLFKKMVEIDKSLEEKCRVMENAYVRRLAQSRLEPSIPLNPPPTPQPLGN